MEKFVVSAVAHPVSLPIVSHVSPARKLGQMYSTRIARQGGREAYTQTDNQTNKQLDRQNLFNTDNRKIMKYTMKWNKNEYIIIIYSVYSISRFLPYLSVTIQASRKRDVVSLVMALEWHSDGTLGTVQVSSSSSPPTATLSPPSSRPPMTWGNPIWRSSLRCIRLWYTRRNHGRSITGEEIGLRRSTACLVVVVWGKEVAEVRCRWNQSLLLYGHHTWIFNFKYKLVNLSQFHVIVQSSSVTKISPYWYQSAILTTVFTVIEYLR